jgi:DNA-binding response OmpR family regulator
MSKKKTSDAIKRSLFIVDDATKFLADQAWAEPICSAQALADRLAAAEPFESVVIVAELDWAGKNLEDFWGFDLAVELRRRYKVDAPVIMVSAFDESLFRGLARKHVKYKLLLGRGVAFLRIKRFSNNFEQALKDVKKRPLESAVIADMNEMLLEQKGVVIDLLTHSLRFGMSETKLTSVFNEAEQYITSAQLALLNWPHFTGAMMDAITDKATFEDLRDGLLAKCESELFSGDTGDLREPKADHKILILEDEPDFKAEIESRLKKHFPAMVVFDEAEKALAEIDADRQHLIKAVISDWRLYKDFDKKEDWQLQGYEVLGYTAKNHTAALFALTSLSDYNVHNIRNELGFNLRLFKKQQFRKKPKAYWDIMADVIRQECDHVSLLLANGPTGAGWKLVRDQYFAKRQTGWASFEAEVDEKASEMYAYYFAAAGRIEDDLLERATISSIDVKNFVLKHHLKNVLIIRRVFLGLYFAMTSGNIVLLDLPPELCKENGNISTELKQHAFDAYSLLKNDWWDDWSANYPAYEIPERAASFDDYLTRFCYVLGIELTKLPAEGLLPEEKLWLGKHGIVYKF